MDMGIILSQPWWLEASLPLCVVQHIMGTWPNSLPFQEASARYVSFSPWALSSLPLSFYFLSRGFKARLCSLADCLFGLLVWHRVLWEVLRLTHCLSSTLFPAHSLPPACPVQLNTHKGLNYEGQTELFWSQSNRKSMEEGFLFSERGR